MWDNNEESTLNYDPIVVVARPYQPWFEYRIVTENFYVLALKLPCFGR